MKSLAVIRDIFSACLLLTVTAVAVGVVGSTAHAVAKRGGDGATLPEKLPAKGAKRTYIDFSDSKNERREKNAKLDKSDVRSATLESALQKSDQDVRAAGTPVEVRSRKILAAPSGDSAESLTAFTAPSPAKIPAKTTKVLPSAKPSEAVASAAPTKIESKPVPSVTESSAPSVTVRPKPSVTPLVTEPELLSTDVEIKAVIVAPPRSTISITTSSPSVETNSFDLTDESTSVQPSITSPASSTISSSTPSVTAAVPEKSADRASDTPAIMTFLRAGYLNANYKKFDDRMKNGATSIGLGAARSFETSWGQFEARGAFDVYHASDQSVTVDNVRMFSARTEVGYWFSRARVKPGLSLGLGWADYSIRSYRSISGEDERNVTIRTHAKSHAFSVIPGASFRVELAKELVVDAQTEFLALLGGDSSDAAQGMGLVVSLGWIF